MNSLGEQETSLKKYFGNVNFRDTKKLNKTKRKYIFKTKR